MDEAIFEEFKGTGNMELRLDRRLAERRIYPAIDVDASSTRHEELLFDRKQLQMIWKLRRVLGGLAADGNAAPGLELLIDRLKTFRTNAEFLNEIAKQPSCEGGASLPLRHPHLEARPAAPQSRGGGAAAASLASLWVSRSRGLAVPTAPSRRAHTLRPGLRGTRGAEPPVGGGTLEVHLFFGDDP